MCRSIAAWFQVIEKFLKMLPVWRFKDYIFLLEIADIKFFLKARVFCREGTSDNVAHSITDIVRVCYQVSALFIYII